MTPREQLVAAYRVFRALQRERGVSIPKWLALEKAERDSIADTCVIPGMTDKLFNAIIEELNNPV